MIKKTYRLFKEYLFQILVVSWLIVIFLFVVLFFYPFRVVELQEFKVVSPVVKKGEYVTYELAFKKNFDLKPDITWYVVDGTRVELAKAGSKRPVGDTTTVQQRYIPNSPIIPVGRYTLQVDICYKIVEVRPDVCYTWVSNEFQIIEGDHD